MNDKISETLTAGELRYMDYIWEYPDGVNSADIFEHFPSPNNTVGVYLFKLSKKGYIKAEAQGKHSIYIPLLTKLEYEQFVMTKKMQKTFGVSSLEFLIANFCGKNRVSEEELIKIRKLIKELGDD